MARAFVTGGFDEIVADALADIDAAQAAASDGGLADVRAWLDARRVALLGLRERVLVDLLLGYPSSQRGQEGVSHRE
jgi:hypothetical protein